MARAKVPTRTMGLKILTLKNEMAACSKIADKMKMDRRMSRVWVLTHKSDSGVMKDAPFAPFIRMKKVMVESATPPQIAP